MEKKIPCTCSHINNIYFNCLLE